MKIELIEISNIKENKKNPRSITDDNFESLVNSLENFPEMMNYRAIIVNRETMEVIGGNQRLKAAKKLGWEKIPVVFADTLTEDQINEFIIKDNISQGEWDTIKLEEKFSDFPLSDWDLVEVEEEREKDESKVEQAKEIYDKGETKQIVIYLEPERHEEISEKIEKIKKDNFLATNGEVLLTLLEIEINERD